MVKIIQEDYTVGASTSGGSVINFDQAINGRLPRVKKISCISAQTLGKQFLTLKHKNSDVVVVDDVDLYFLTSNYDEKFTPEAPGGSYIYSIRNADTSEKTVSLVFELEYLEF